jgi:hypothetical protein
LELSCFELPSVLSFFCPSPGPEEMLAQGVLPGGLSRWAVTLGWILLHHLAFASGMCTSAGVHASRVKTRELFFSLCPPAPTFNCRGMGCHDCRKCVESRPKHEAEAKPRGAEQEGEEQGCPHSPFVQRRSPADFRIRRLRFAEICLGVTWASVWG